MKRVLKEWFVEAPWGKIALISWGDPCGEKVLLVHGRQDSAVTFEPLLQLLPDTLHYVALDLPGHGYSDPFPTGVMLSRIHFVAPIEIVVQHLKWKAFTYLCHSMGGEVGLYFNATYPNLIKKFIHLDIGIALHTSSEKPIKTFYEAYEKYYDNYRDYNVDDRVYTLARAVRAVAGARGLADRAARLVLSGNLRPVPRHTARHTAECERGEENAEVEYRLSWDKRLKNLPSLNLPHEQMLYLFTTNIPPTLFIAAAQSVALYRGQPAETLIREMGERVTSFHYRVVEGSHDVHLTNPERIARDIAAFITSEAVKSKL